MCFHCLRAFHLHLITLSFMNIYVHDRGTGGAKQHRLAGLYVNTTDSIEQMV